MIKSIIFDCYGTLINTGRGSLDATERILRSKEEDINPEIFYASWKRFFKGVCNQDEFVNEATAFSIILERTYNTYFD